MILALDLGTQMGWALRKPYPMGGGYSIDSGTVSFASDKRISGGGMKFLKMKEWLQDWRHANENAGIQAIYFEEVKRHIGTAAAHAYGGFLAILLAYCEAENIPYESVPVGTIKKHWTGKGNAKKDAMIAAAVSKGFSPKDDNEADAIALLDYVTSRKQELVA